MPLEQSAMLGAPADKLSAKAVERLHFYPNSINTLSTMDGDILIVRNGDHYRLLHGQLRLAAQLSISHEVCVNVKDEGAVRIIKARGGLLVERGNQRLPLNRND